MTGVPGICDRCGQRYPLADLKAEYVLGSPNGLRTCQSCYDESHPQLDTRNVKASDKQMVDDPRSDVPEHDDSRTLYGFDPVGHETTGTLDVFVGSVTAGASS